MSYSVYCFRFEQDDVLVKSNLTLEDAKWICSRTHTSSQTTESEALMKRWGPGPWFYGYREN
jgi:hypothetical protein